MMNEAIQQRFVVYLHVTDTSRRVKRFKSYYYCRSSGSCLCHRRAAAFLAISDRCSLVSFSARALPPALARCLTVDVGSPNAWAITSNAVWLISFGPLDIRIPPNRYRKGCPMLLRCTHPLFHSILRMAASTDYGSDNGNCALFLRDGVPRLFRFAQMLQGAWRILAGHTAYP